MTEGNPSPPSAILLIAHGSRHDAANREVLEMANRLSLKRGGEPVVGCFLEIASPNILEGFETLAQTGAKHVVAVPFFLATGSHVSKDIPAFLATCGQNHPDIEIRLTPAIGPDPLLDEIALLRVKSA